MKFTPTQLSNISRCAAFASLAHKGQTRYMNRNGDNPGRIPYIVHPARVATLVAYYGGSHLAVMASWLHDVLEDCPEFRGSVFRSFVDSLKLPGKEPRILIVYVGALTKDDSIKNRMERLNEQLDAVEDLNETVLIKICDRIDNLTITEYENNQKRIEGMSGEEFVKMYLKESAHLLERLKSSAIELGYKDAWKVLKEIIDGWGK